MTLIENHAYVSLRQCIADFLGKGYHTNEISQKANDLQQFLIDSNIAMQVLKRAIACNRETSLDNLLVILGIQWSDNFEPNTVNTEPEILGSRENTTLPGLYFPENPKSRFCIYV